MYVAVAELPVQNRVNFLLRCCSCICLVLQQIAEFEQAGQDTDYLGIERFCLGGAIRTQRHFQPGTLARTVFPDEAKPHGRLLGNSWEEIFPKLQPWSEMTDTKEGWWFG